MGPETAPASPGNIGSQNVGPPRDQPRWILVVGAIFGALTLLFFMYLVLHPDTLTNPQTRLPISIVGALGVALAASFLGGAAIAQGRIPLPGGMDPIVFSSAGGIAVFVIVFALLWVITQPVKRVTLLGKILDTHTGAGIPGAKVSIKADDYESEHETTDRGDVSFPDLPLFNKQVSVSVEADDYLPAEPQTAVIRSYDPTFTFRMQNCYNGLWHEIPNYETWPPGAKPNKWQFRLTGHNQLHISRQDGFMWGDFQRKTDGSWTGQISNSNNQTDSSPILNAPNSTCTQIITNKSWSYQRDTFE